MVQTRSQFRQVNVGGEPCEVLRATMSSGTFVRHYHETYTLGLVRHGVNAFRNRWRDEEVSQGRICIVNPGDVHDGGRADTPWSYDNIYVPPALMEAVALEAGLPRRPDFFEGCIVDTAASQGLNRFFCTVFDQDADPDEVEQACWFALGRLIRLGNPSPTASAASLSGSSIAGSAVDFIHENWAVPITLTDIAAAANASRYTVIRAVGARTGLTPRALLLQERVRRAKLLLLEGMPIVSAAAECQFSDQAHLTREMKKRMGVTPGVIRSGAA